MADRTTPLGAGERAWLDRLIAPLPRGATILALHPGGGEPIARYLIDHGFHVVGVEPSETLIGLARTRFPRERWLPGDMREVAIEESFDGVLAWGCLSGLSHSEHDAVMKRMTAWMKAGARLLFNLSESEEAAPDGFRSGSRYSDSPDARSLGDALVRSGLIEMAHVAHDPTCGGASVWLARKP